VESAQLHRSSIRLNDSRHDVHVELLVHVAQFLGQSAHSPSSFMN